MIGTTYYMNGGIWRVTKVLDLYAPTYPEVYLLEEVGAVGNIVWLENLDNLPAVSVPMEMKIELDVFVF